MLSSALKACLLGAALLCGVAGDRPPVLSHPVDVARPPAAWTAVNKSLREATCIRAEFADLKSIAVLKKPLKSAGTLVFLGRAGLYRATKEPFASELLVTPEGITQRDASGRVEQVDVARQPLAKGFIDAFLLVFSGDDQALGSEFELYFDGDENTWTLGFVPRKTPLSKFVASLVVTGKRGLLETLLVTEVNGDRTTTRFSNVVTDRELSADEKKRFFGWRK